MLTRATLNAQQPRTLQDAARDPFDWIEGPQPGDSAGRYRRLGNRLMLALVIGAIGAAIFGGL